MVEQVSSNVPDKVKRAIALIRQCDGVVVALSAGVDSSLVALLAHKALGERAVAVTGVSESLPVEELEIAAKTAKAIGIKHLTARTNELENPNYSSNPHNRCYYCKETLYAELQSLAESLGLQSILDGTQLDDLNDDRPGLVAARNAGVRSPLLECSFSKSEVREAARMLGLSVWDKPAVPCLSSRVTHGEVITAERLAMVDRAESYIKQLTGARDLRVRYSQSTARIEVSPEDRELFFDTQVMDQIYRELRLIGFYRTTLDLRGYQRREKSQVDQSLVLPMANVSR